MKESIIKDKSYAFALRIITLARWLRERKEYDLASQVLRAGTGIGANVEEALAGVSRADFIAKMAVASKRGRRITGFGYCGTPRRCRRSGLRRSATSALSWYAS